ncbi:MAG: hypothetical protein ACK4HV_02155, partial [Parachlamydiaceae bacterium]
EGEWKNGEKYKGFITGPDTIVRRFDLQAIKRKTTNNKNIDCVNLRKLVLQNNFLAKQKLAKSEKNDVI